MQEQLTKGNKGLDHPHLKRHLVALQNGRSERVHLVRAKGTFLQPLDYPLLLLLFGVSIKVQLKDPRLARLQVWTAVGAAEHILLNFVKEVEGCKL